MAGEDRHGIVARSVGLLNPNHYLAVAIAHLLGKPNFELIRHDIVEPILVEVDQIYNLACPASPVQADENLLKTISCHRKRQRPDRSGRGAGSNIDSL